jgi:hypothetical protein
MANSHRARWMVVGFGAVIALVIVATIVPVGAATPATKS